MTVQTNTNVASFNGNGVTQIFPIAFKFNNDTDLVVLLVDDATGAVSQLTLNSDYTVSGEGDEDGGVINAAVAPATGKRLQVTRVVDILQLTDLRNQGKFFAEVHEDALDLLTMIAQQQESAMKSALRVAESDPEPARMPTIAQRAGKVLSFDSAGNPVAVVPAADSSTALRLELAADSGAGIVGFDLETVYPAGSAGRALRVVEIKAGELETKAGELETKAGELETKAGELEGGLADLEDGLQALDSQIDFTIIYPNGGSEASPANVAVNSRYVESNPFPGHHLLCRAQIYYQGRWVTTGHFNSPTANAGVTADYDELDDKVVITCMGNSLLYGWQVSGSSTPVSNTGAGLATTAPCRVLLYKIKGAIA